MLVFLDESFRTHVRRNVAFGVLAGVAIPEDLFPGLQRDIFNVRRPYHDIVLRETDELHGKQLLRQNTFRVRDEHGYSYHWNLAEEVVQFCRSRGFRVFGVVCFRSGLNTFICDDENKVAPTFRYLFERIDTYMKREFPGRYAKLIFDDRGHGTNAKNAKAITNFFVRSAIGIGYDSIVRVPFFAVSQGNNYGLQIADLITTVIALRFQGELRVGPIWRTVTDMLYRPMIGGTRASSLKVIREQFQP